MKTKRHHIKLPPVAIQKLLTKKGMNGITKTLGITQTAIKKYIKNNAAPQATEMAAQMLFDRETGIPEVSQKTALVRGEPEFINMVNKMAKLSHGTFTAID